MAKKGIKSVEDVLEFFQAYNSHDWETVFVFIHQDCIWDASEKQLNGKEEIINYWTNYHVSFKESLGKPEHIVLGKQFVYLQVPIHLEFIQDGAFLGKSFKRGDTLDFLCADFYKLDEEGMIKSGQVFIKPPHVE